MRGLGNLNLMVEKELRCIGRVAKRCYSLASQLLANSRAFCPSGVHLHFLRKLNSSLNMTLSTLSCLIATFALTFFCALL